VLLYGVHGSEAMGARSIVQGLASALHGEHVVRILGPVMPWSTARSYRFDADLVDPNRAFAAPPNDGASNNDCLNQVWQLWNTMQPASPDELLAFIHTCHQQVMAIEELICTPQFTHPGLPSYSLSSQPLRYQARVDQLALQCCDGLEPGQSLTLVDVHLGVGDHGRTVVHVHDRDAADAIPAGSLLKQLQQTLVRRGYSVRASVTETGTESNLHGLLALLQELAHRSSWGRQRQVPLMPLVGPTWRAAVCQHLVSDLRQHVLPVLL
jgi:hypothetical protein